MSILSVRTALETKLNDMTSALSTSWENTKFDPEAGTPYQAAYVISAPENPTMGTDFYRINGIFQINLFYPLQAGTNDAETRAELIKTTFSRGTAMTSSDVKVIVNRTPDIGKGRVDNDRWMIPVKIIFYADIY